MSDEGVKYDEGKLRWDLLPILPVEKVVEIITYGANKYEPNGWRQVSRDRYIAAFGRHYTAYLKGEEFDEESGLRHIHHAICNLMFISELDRINRSSQECEKCRNLIKCVCFNNLNL